MEKVSVFADGEDLAEQAARVLRTAIEEDLNAGRDPALILAGGSTPRECYRKLAGLLQPLSRDLGRVHWFIGDERWVGRESPQSNERMIRETLLGPLQVPQRRIHSWNAGQGSPIGCARKYQEVLKGFFDSTDRDPDLLLLGMGADGHTASLFPDGWALRGGAPNPARDAMPMSPHLPGLTAAVYAPGVQSYRVTMTADFLKRSRRILFLVSGRAKSETLNRVLQGDARLPASWLNVNQTRFLVTRDAVEGVRL